jgi:hypothetical protein
MVLPELPDLTKPLIHYAVSNAPKQLNEGTKEVQSFKGHSQSLVR